MSLGKSLSLCASVSPLYKEGNSPALPPRGVVRCSDTVVTEIQGTFGKLGKGPLVTGSGQSLPQGRCLDQHQSPDFASDPWKLRHDFILAIRHPAFTGAVASGIFTEPTVFARSLRLLV